MADVNLYYGPPGTGKTQGIIARMIAEAKLGRKSIAFVGDGSGVAYRASGLVEAGYLTVIQFNTWDWPFSVAKRMCSGWLPARANDPTSRWVHVGMVQAGVKNPDGTVTVTYPDSPKGREKELVSAEIAEIFALPELGVIAIEGAAVLGIYLMGMRKGGLAFRGSRGEKIGQDPPHKILDAEVDPITNVAIRGTGTGEAFGGNGLPHYGFAQGETIGCIQMSAALPALEVIWTTHERSVENKVSKETIIGPEAAGGALTASLGRLFGHVLHFATATKRVRGQKDGHTDKLIDDLDIEYRVYTRDHINADGTTAVKYLAITRGVGAGQMPLFFEHDTPGASVLAFYAKVHEEGKKLVLDLPKWKAA